MARQLVLICGVLLLEASTGLAGTPTRKDGKQNDVEVRFGDGSKVRMTILQDKLEVVTRFGRLQVPTNEIRGIDFGLHIPEAVEKKIEGLIKQLSSPTFKERDAAVGQLAELGAHAYPSLLKAAQSSDLEVVQRAQAALKRIRANVPAEMLTARLNDHIITTDFPISGRITSPTIRAHNPIFGELDLKLSELRSIAWISGKVETEVTVEAAKYASAGQWLDTGLTLDGTTGLTITASGEVDLLSDGSGEFITGPAGRNFGPRRVAGKTPGALMGKIGETGQPFLIGERYSSGNTPAGKLYLQIVPPPFMNGMLPSGSYRVAIRTGFTFGGQ